MLGQPGLFDRDERYAALAAAGDPLERLAAVVDFELFRDELDAVLDRSDRTRGGHRCDRHLAAAANPLPRTDPATAATDPFDPMQPQTSPQNRFFEVSS